MIEHLGTAIGIPMIYVSHQPEETARLTDTILQLALVRKARLPRCMPRR